MYQRNNPNLPNARNGGGGGGDYNNDNDNNYENSSESDSDSDAEMEENGDADRDDAEEAEEADENPNDAIGVGGGGNGIAGNLVAGGVGGDGAGGGADDGNNNELLLEEDDGRQHNGILERIDYLDRRSNENVQDEPRRPLDGAEFDDNSRGNFELPLLGAVLDIPPPVNDDSSRESMDMDDDNGVGVVELGNINIAAPSTVGCSGSGSSKNDDALPSGSSGGGVRLNSFFNDGFKPFRRSSPVVEEVVKAGGSGLCGMKSKMLITNTNSNSSTSSSGSGSSIDDCEKIDEIKSMDAVLVNVAVDDTTTMNCNNECCDSVNNKMNSSSINSVNISNNENSLNGSSKDTDDDEHSCQKDRIVETTDNGDGVAAASVASTSMSTSDHDATSHTNKFCDNTKITKTTEVHSKSDGEMPSTSSAASSSNCSKDCAKDDARCNCDDLDELMRQDGDNKTCGTCFGEDMILDQANGHTSKMAIDITKCAKCSIDRKVAENNPVLASDVAAADDREEVAPVAEDGPHVDVPVAGEAAAEEPVPAIVAIELLPRGNVRPRDADAAAENGRPSKKLKLNNGNAANRTKTPRTIFHKALDAVQMTWDNQHLKFILASNTYCANSSNASKILSAASSSSSSPSLSKSTTFNATGQPLWHEPLSMCAARVDSLRSHGHTDAALRLSVSVVRTMKQIQIDAQLLWHRFQAYNAKEAAQKQLLLQQQQQQQRHCCCDCRKDGRMMASGSNAGGHHHHHHHHQHQHHNNHQHMNSSHHHNHHPYNHHNQASSSSSSMRNNNFKMYRYDYGSNSNSNNRYDGCKRCLETRDRIGYHQYGSRYNGMHGLPSNSLSTSSSSSSFFRPTNYGNVYDNHRYAAGSIGTGSTYRMHNNHHHHHHSQFAPSLGSAAASSSSAAAAPISATAPPAGGNCHAENCNFVQRQNQSVAASMVSDSYFFGPRPHCSKEIEKYVNENYGPRCSGSGETNAKQRCECNKSSVDRNQASGSSSSSSSASCSRSNKDETTAMATSKPCAQHTKNQCCIKNYCNTIVPNNNNEKPLFSKCCSSSSTSSATSTNHCECGCGSQNSYGRNYGFCKRPAEQCSYPYCGGNSSSSATNHHQMHQKPNRMYNIINFGASTSKASTAGASSTITSMSSEFVRNKKPACASNCLDCTVGCEVEFPLDAVACIFDCLTEACIIPDSINGPDMGRLSFDSVTGAAEDGSTIPPRYQHVPVPYSTDRKETYLTLAFEVS